MSQVKPNATAVKPDEQTAALTTWSNLDTTTYTKINPPAPGRVEGATCRARVSVSCDAKPGTAVTVRFVLRDDAEVYAYRDFTCVAPTNDARTTPAGGAGRFLLKCQCQDDAYNVDFFDLLGADENRGVYWFVGLPAAAPGGVANAQVNLWYSPVSR